jgi:hypothetical protein
VIVEAIATRLIHSHGSLRPYIQNASTDSSFSFPFYQRLSIIRGRASLARQSISAIKAGHDLDLVAGIRAIKCERDCG